MLLGGIRYLLPAIEVAHRHNCKVITVDNVPNNYAHRYSDEFYNVSILNKESVLQLANKLGIDGILSYAVDPGVVTAAYVAEQMGLPFSCSYETASILQNKAKFRDFLHKHGFNTPRAKGYSRVEDALQDVSFFKWPVIVKPVDSAGSKGVIRVDDEKFLRVAILHALEESHCGSFIIEDYLEKFGDSCGIESFFVEGKLVYNAIYDQVFDEDAANPFIPSAECWPSAKAEWIQNSVKHQLQKLSDYLHFKTGLFNVEFRNCGDGKVYLMEVSPRAGGNRLAEILNYATDVNIIEAEVLKAIGEPISKVLHEPNYNGYYCVLVLHCLKSGLFLDVTIEDCFNGEVIEKEIRINKGDRVEAFYGANNAIGTLFLRFNTRGDMDYALLHQNEWLRIIVL